MRNVLLKLVVREGSSVDKKASFRSGSSRATLYLAEGASCDGMQ